MKPRATHILGLVALALACALLLAQAAFPPRASLSSAMVVSVSADGRYAISSHQKRELVLWDIEARTHRLISREANVYSAYFIPGRDAFLWQDLDDNVRVSTVDGTGLLRFTHFPTYGHLISVDLGTYIASDQGWGIHLGWGDALQTIKASDGLAALGFGKLLNLQLDPGSGLLLSAGYGYNFDDKYSLAEERQRGSYKNIHGVAVWSIEQLEPLHKLPGNAAKTHATLSPDGKFVVSVDENLRHYVWRTDTGEKAYEVSTLGSGIWQPAEDPNELGTFDPSGVRVVYPKDFDSGRHRNMVAVAFLDSEHYAAFHYDEPYASLWQLGDPHAIRMLSLGKKPFPATNSYARNASIASAPGAGILVTGQRQGGGINVYRFDPRARSLERIWAPTP